MENQSSSLEQGKELYFFSTAVCWRCKFDLKQNYPASWHIKTGCPSCHYSFVE